MALRSEIFTASMHFYVSMYTECHERHMGSKAFIIVSDMRDNLYVEHKSVFKDIIAGKRFFSLYVSCLKDN